ncbi:hypothetical protein [Myroides sp. WP-1]|uniref:hypothetical protein n=1 Tax=Myroides sp. WP-1 TaxID=2759944 RepID=UPI0015F98598|nr:hypothetical protein [Myroides sp. WP-1]MBB1140838.1 hypothetical protein [Myroides sp. WP-1]
MNVGEYIIKLIDGILDFFQLIKDYLDDALHIFEKIKEVVLDIIDYFIDTTEELSQESVKLFEDLEEDHFFI